MDNDKQNLLDKLLTEAMNAEEEARKFYADAANKASSEAGKRLFTELADFEQGHYDRLRDWVADQLGYSVIRFKNDEIELETDKALSRLLEYVRN